MMPSGISSGRRSPSAEVESPVYFSCLEALQNAGKYAGEGASARVCVGEREGELWFEVTDDGAGFESNGSADGSGLTNMRDRVGAVGGTLNFESSSGKETIIRGSIPVNQRS